MNQSKLIKFILTIGFLGALFSCHSELIGKNAASKAKEELPAGAYKLDRAHASLIFKVSHMGFSNYTARFKKFDADLQFDPKNPAKSKVVAVIDPSSIETDYPDPKKLDFNAQLRGAKWLDVVKFPKIIFESTKIELTSANTANIIGNLELHGIKYPVTLKAMFNGGYASNPMDPGGARIGFSARGFLKRSDFGIKYGIPEPGSNMGVGDYVQFIIEAEFNRPTIIAATKNNSK